MHTDSCRPLSQQLVLAVPVVPCGWQPSSNTCPDTAPACLPMCVQAADGGRVEMAFDVGSPAAYDLEDDGMVATPGILEPGVLDPSKDRARVLSFGPAGAGLSFHSHGEAWLGLVGGTKVWLIASPDALPVPEIATALTMTALQWVRSGGMKRVPPGSVKVRAVHVLSTCLPAAF